jgi:hypothetical protein
MGPAARLFAEYNSTTPDGRPIDLSHRRTWYQQSEKEGGRRIEGLTAQLTKRQAARYRYNNVIKDADGWNPRSFFQSCTKVMGLKAVTGKLVWRRNKKDMGYVVFCDGQVIGFTRAASFPTAEGRGKRYYVRSVNRWGTLGPESVVVQL